MNIKRSSIMIMIMMIFICGCTPYFLLDDKGKVQRIIEKYVTLINKGDYAESFKLLTFIHQPKKRNQKMYEMAQNLQANSYENIQYIVKDIVLKDNIASVPVDMIFSTTRGRARKIKVESQLYMYRPKDSPIWFIVSGNMDSRAVFYEKFIKDNIEGMGIIEDRTYLSIDGRYISQDKVRFEEGKLFILENGEWIEKD